MATTDKYGYMKNKINLNTNLNKNNKTLSSFITDTTNRFMDIAKKTASNLKTGTEDSSNLFRDNYPTLSSSGSGSGGGGGMIDLSNIMSSYEQAAESNRQVAKQTYESKRSDLLTSLKRFQEQNAKDVQRQQRTYTSDQAAIESAIAQADRQNRINAASRGLGGSGLQQLSQLQNLLSQGQTISDMATENQETLENLRTNLANYEEDTNKSLKDVLDTYNNTLSSINSDLALNKANIEYQARENAASRAAAASSAASQIAAQNAEYEMAAAQDEKAFNASLSKLQKTYSDSLNKAKDSKAIKKAKKTYEKNVADLLETYTIPASNEKYQSAYDYLSNTYANKLKSRAAESRINLWNWIIDPSDYLDAKAELEGNNNFRIW